MSGLKKKVDIGGGDPVLIEACSPRASQHWDVRWVDHDAIFVVENAQLIGQVFETSSSEAF